MANIKDLVDETVEAGLIASLLYNPELCYHSEDLTERHFSDPVNSVMYYAITQLVKKGIFKIDAINILSVISDSPKLQKMYSNITAETINEIISLGEDIARTEVEDYVNLAETLRNKLTNGFVFISNEVDGKTTFVCASSKEAIQKGIKAGDIVKMAATMCGGNGGGRPDMAQAGGKNPEKITEALTMATEVITKQIG